MKAVRAELDVILDVVSRLRADDLAEFSQLGVTGEDIAKWLAIVPYAGWSFHLDDGKAAGVVIGYDTAPGVGYLFLLPTDDLPAIGRPLAKWARRALAVLFATTKYRVLETQIAEWRKPAIRWLKFLGAEQVGEKMVGDACFLCFQWCCPPLDKSNTP